MHKENNTKISTIHRQLNTQNLNHKRYKIYKIQYMIHKIQREHKKEKQKYEIKI